MDPKAFRTNNGRVFLDFLVSGTNQSYLCPIEEKNNPLPYSEDILQYRGTREGAELVFGKYVVEEATSPYMTSPYLKMYEDFSDSKSITYNRDTDELHADKELVDMLFNAETLYHNPEWLRAATRFVMYVIMERNPFVYSVFSEYTNATKKYMANLGYKGGVNSIINLWKNLDNLNNFEKIIKGVGEDFIFDNISKEEFNLNNAKKLHQVMELPMTVAETISKMGIEEVFNDVKAVASVDKNYAITLFDFITAFKKAFPGKEFSSKADVIQFIQQISKLMKTGYYDASIKDLLNFLVNENMNYNTFYLPVREAGELLDYLKIGMNMAAYNPDIKFERFPRNIQKAHNVINLNNNIVSKPRPEEFADAVARQAFLNDDKDEDYVFMVPKTELDLLNEGNMLHHCVASYRDRIIDNGTMVVLMRQKGAEDTPFVTIEYLPGGAAGQVRGMFNADVTDPDVLAAVNRWLARAARRESK
jgi:hypothetical protein